MLDLHLGGVCKVPDYYADGVRRRGGVNLIWASVGNCGNQLLDVNGETQEAETLSVRVQMQVTGTEQPVVVMKLL